MPYWQTRPMQSTANIIPIPKKGDLNEPMNYRGICLSSLVAKALNRMVLNRLNPEIETILRRNQNWFRPGRSITQQILVLRRLIEGVKSRKLPAVLTFIDFKKAFDNVHSGKMLKILEAYGIQVKIVELIRLMYEKTMARLQSPNSWRRNGIVRDTIRCVTERYLSTLPLCNSHRLLYEASHRWWCGVTWTQSRT